MKALLILMVAHITASQLIPKSSNTSVKTKTDQSIEDFTKLQEVLQNKLQQANSDQKANELRKQLDTKNSGRKSKSLAFFPFFPPHPPVPYAISPGMFFPRNQEVLENAYQPEWRTEPFKKNPSLLDSPTYYIRLPPNPYIFVPGLGYISRPPALSDPELLESHQPEASNEVGNDIHENFYKVPINFISNGKPTSVYQLPNGQVPKPESSLINLSKGPYVFNGKPSEIYLVAQIYDALYGDELSHFYP